MGPPQGRAEGEENLPQPAGHTLLNAPQAYKSEQAICSTKFSLIYAGDTLILMLLDPSSENIFKILCQFYLPLCMHILMRGNLYNLLQYM